MTKVKRSDIFTIIIAASVGMLAAFLASNAILGDPNMEKASFKVVKEITSNVDEPDPELFNREAINPTVEVEVGVCEDTNGNGILDKDERDKCLGNDTTPATPSDNTEDVVDNGTAN